MSTNIQLADVIKVIRSKKGLSASVVAERAKISPGSLSDLESGRYSPTVKTFLQIAIGLEVEPEILIRIITRGQTKSDGCERVVHAAMDALIDQVFPDLAEAVIHEAEIRQLKAQVKSTSKKRDNPPE